MTRQSGLTPNLGRLIKGYFYYKRALKDLWTSHFSNIPFPLEPHKSPIMLLKFPSNNIELSREHNAHDK